MHIKTGKLSILVLISSVAFVGLLLALAVLGGYFRRTDSTTSSLTVYCASGVEPAVEEIAKQFEQELGTKVHLYPGSSGVLEQQIRSVGEGDLYIPAGRVPFLERMRSDQLVMEILPLAKFRLVLAVQSGNPKNITSLDDLLRNDVSVVMANEPAAVGLVTRKVIADWPKSEQLIARATMKPTVTGVAGDVRVGVRCDAGFVWDSTARQFGLEIVPIKFIDQHALSGSTISAGVLSCCEQPTLALRFARYLAAPEKGQPAFEKEHYEPADGDPWAARPKIVLYSGGVNRRAISETLQEFQTREGCEIVTTFQGCGSLVTMMKAGQMPDAYFACDASFLNDVRTEFDDPVIISRTDMVMLVQAGNPKNIQSLSDLAKEGIRVGMADEQLTALGSLTEKLFREAGVHDEIIKNRRATTPTADLLVTQLTTVDKLDAVIVYRANCQFVGDKATIVEIDHPAAHAVQPFAIYQQTKYPQLTQRLLEAIGTTASRARFEQSGFSWQKR